MTAEPATDFRSEPAPQPPILEEDRMRADLYNFLGLLLARPADPLLLAQSAALTGDDTALGRAITALAEAASRTTPDAVEQEFNKLFIGLGRGELLPYASYYLTGFLNEKPLAGVRRSMWSLGMQRSDTVFEPEDNMASLLELMGAMIVGRFGVPADLDQQKTVFNAHLRPWAGHFFSDLEHAKNAEFYAPAGALGRQFMAIEAEGFRMSGS